MATAIIATCALLFTVLTFWLLNARRGRIESFEPNTFSFYMDSARVLLRLPLVLYNTGATPIIVQNLRLRFLSEGQTQVLPWDGSRSQIKPDEGEDHKFAAVFSVAGRTACQMFPEFIVPSREFSLEARSYPMVVEAKLSRDVETKFSRDDEWKLIMAFIFYAGQITTPGNYRTYANVPPSEECQQEAAAALKKLEEDLARLRGQL